MRGIPKDAPLDYSRITENLYIGAWPTKYNVETIKSLDVTLIIAAILERTDKELNQPPLDWFIPAPPIWVHASSTLQNKS